MRVLKLFVHYKLTNERIPIEIRSDQRVSDLLNYVNDYFKLGASYGGTEKRVTVLSYGGGDLQPEWILSDLNFEVGTTLKCYLRVDKLPEYSVYIKCRKEYYKYYNSKIDISSFTVFQLRVILSKEYGFPLSIFHLKTEDSKSNKEMLDNHRIIDYGVDRYGRLILETWVGWDSFLKNSMIGYTKQLIKTMSSDEIIRQYQAKVALYIAAHYGHYDLARSMMSIGARPDRPVGEHPSRQWCVEVNSRKPEYLRCPIHEAVQSGQLKIVTLFSRDIWVLLEPDGYGVLPWRLALRNDHKDPIKNEMQKDVARFLLAKQFSGKIKLVSSTNRSCNISYNLYYHFKSWAERARQKVFVSQGIGKTSFGKKRPFHQGALVGYKVLVDGYNNNFKDYPNMVEELQSKNRLFYFIDEEEKKNTINPEIYFRTLNTIGAFKMLKLKSVAKFSKLVEDDSKHEHIKQKHSRPSDPKAHGLWLRIINKIINKNILERNEENLAALGYDIDEDDDESAKSETDEKSNKKTPTNQKNKTPTKENKTVNNQKSNVPEKLLAQRQKIKSVTVNDFSSNEKRNAYEKKISKSSPHTSMSMTSPTKFNSEMFLPKIQSETSSIIDEGNISDRMRRLISIANIEEETTTFTNLRNYTSSSFKTPSLQEKTMQSYLKLCNGLTPREIAKQCLANANTFIGKSWLKQIRIGAGMVREQTKRRFDNIAITC